MVLFTNCFSSISIFPLNFGIYEAMRDDRITSHSSCNAIAHSTEMETSVAMHSMWSIAQTKWRRRKAVKKNRRIFLIFIVHWWLYPCACNSLDCTSRLTWANTNNNSNKNTPGCIVCFIVCLLFLSIRVRFASCASRATTLHDTKNVCRAENRKKMRIVSEVKSRERNTWNSTIDWIEVRVFEDASKILNTFSSTSLSLSFSLFLRFQFAESNSTARTSTTIIQLQAIIHRLFVQSPLLRLRSTIMILMSRNAKNAITSWRCLNGSK